MKKTTSRTRARRKPVRKATKTGHRVMRAHTGRRSELFGLALLAAGLISICGICGLTVGFVGVYFAKFLRYFFGVGSILIAVISGFVPLMHIVELSNTGTLAVFLVNFIGIVVMRRKHPEIPRKFHCPLLYLIAPVGIIVCFYLIYELSTLTHILFAGWILLGLIVYYAYSRKHSIVRE